MLCLVRSYPYEGNQHGRAPEAQNTFYLHRMLPDDARYARIDFSKQSSFEVGSLLYYIATHEDALPEYPSGYEYGPSGGITYDVLTAVEWAFLPAMYTATNALATIDAFPVASAALTFVGTASTVYPQNLVYHKNAITLATADLLLPQGVDMASRQVHNGISMRIVRQYDINNDRMPCRVDVLYGFSTIRPPMACRIFG